MDGSDDDAVICPSEGTADKDLGPLAVLVSSEADLKMLCRRFRIDGAHGIRLFNSRIHTVVSGTGAASLIGPMIGAPYAVMILEKLIARGVTSALFFGWCGSISSQAKIGDIILATGAVIDEGTSAHYHPDASGLARPAGRIVEGLRQLLIRRQRSFHEGWIWTTDAVFRETRQKVLSFQRRSVLAVEMEISALYTVAGFRNVQIGGILVVSDDLSTLTWKPGFKSHRFQNSRRIVCEVIEELCNIQQQHPFGKESRI